MELHERLNQPGHPLRKLREYNAQHEAIVGIPADNENDQEKGQEA